MLPVLKKKIAGIPFQDEETASQFKHEQISKFVDEYRADFSRLYGAEPEETKKRRILKLVTKHLSVP